MDGHVVGAAESTVDAVIGLRTFIFTYFFFIVIPQPAQEHKERFSFTLLSSLDTTRMDENGQSR